MNHLRRSGQSGAIALLVALMPWGCGMKSALIPPEQARPERIVDLRAATAPGGIKLTWSRPTRYTGGGRMRDLDRFVVLRAQPGEQFTSVASVGLTDKERFQQQRQLSFVDSGAQPGRSYRYEVIALTTDGYQSVPSNQVELVRAPPALNPDTFTLPQPEFPP